MQIKGMKFFNIFGIFMVMLAYLLLQSKILGIKLKKTNL